MVPDFSKLTLTLVIILLLSLLKTLPLIVPFPNIVSITNVLIERELLTFPAESVTVIVQFEYVPSLKALNVMVLFPLEADVVLEEQEPPYVIVPASVDENV